MTQIWEATIGLEVHVQLATRSKLFSSSPTQYGSAPNSQVSGIDLGLPGVLPLLNAEAVDMGILFGLAVQGVIPECIRFARKNYFYPDLPKGYQISQADAPIVLGGTVSVYDENEAFYAVPLIRAHLEEDAGKSLHEYFDEFTGIDLNRAGVPLLEIVTEPVMKTAKEAGCYLRSLHRLVRYLGISDGNMQEGSFRCDANVSVKPMGREELGTRVEVKNLNSFRFVEQAIEYEIQRQAECLEAGGVVRQETRLFDPQAQETRVLRMKEKATDYRYFNDPDVPAVLIKSDKKKRLRERLPELPEAKWKRFVFEWQLSPAEADILLQEPALMRYFEAVVQDSGLPQLTARWLVGDWMGLLKKTEQNIENCPVSIADFSALMQAIHTGELSGKLGKMVLELLFSGHQNTRKIMSDRQLSIVSDPAQLMAWIDMVLHANPAQWQQYREGKERLFGFFVGQIMQVSKGKADPELLNQHLLKRLKP